MDFIKTPKTADEFKEIMVDNVKLLERYNARKSTTGTLYLTTTHLIFVDAAGKKETWILHTHMSSVERLPLTTGGSPLQIRCKDFRCVTFVIPRDRECQDITESLLQLSQPNDIESLYAFHYTLNDDFPKTTGWHMYDTDTEYLRMGVPNNQWSLTNMNKYYELCDTYPMNLYVPACATTPIIVGSSKFRSRGRLPVLSYLHRDSQAAICRCSQPLSGFSARCVEDEQMLHAILKSNPASKYMYVVDTRPKINAMANKAAGKGFENESYYSDIKFYFCGIENIHVMRNSLQKLIDLCEMRNPSMSAFLTGLESCGWLKHIKSVLDTSVFIAKAVTEGTSVLVHCSDGWDRTAQTCSLSALILDPYYRTIQGFQALIEKEWLSFGHKFTDRCGLLGTVDAKEVSPVFTQFIESVWQLMQQFPCAFQFNDRFLITIHDHVYSCQFGTFIGNCEKDRIDLRLSERTYSLWGYITKHMPEFINPLYKKSYEHQNSVIMPNTSPQCIRFWAGMYNRYENGIHPRENIVDILSSASDHCASLEDHVQLLEKRITQICKLLGKPDQVIEKKLNGYLSQDSLDKMEDNISDLPLKITKDLIINGDADLLVNIDTPEKENSVSKKSDSESGYEEMSKSVPDDLPGKLNPSGIADCRTTKTSMARSESNEQLSLDYLCLELTSVALDWKSFRNVQNCSCASPFDRFTKKFHCWKCGDVFCTRCLAKNIPLPGHYSKRPVPVCRPCYKDIRHSPSMEFPPPLTNAS